jgi:hypothetical protein
MMTNLDVFLEIYSPFKQFFLIKKTAIIKIRDMSYLHWFGKNPKQYLIDYLSKKRQRNKSNLFSLQINC